MQFLVGPNEDPAELLIFAAVETPQKEQGNLIPRWTDICRICCNTVDRDDLVCKREKVVDIGSPSRG